MSYRKVSSGWIKGRVGRALRGDADALALAYYLMTAEENVKGLGLFWQPIGVIAVLFGIPSERLEEALRKLQGLGFSYYDPEHEIHFVVESARHEWQEPPSGNPNQVKGAQTTLFEQLDLARKSSLFKAWLDRYHESWAKILEPLAKDSGRLGEAFRNGFESPEPDPEPDPEPTETRADAREECDEPDDVLPGEPSTPGTRAGSPPPPGGSAAGGAAGVPAAASGAAGPAQAELGLEAADGDAAEVHDRLLAICGRTQFGAEELRILERRLATQPAWELIETAKLLRRRLKDVRSPLAYLDTAAEQGGMGPWDAAAGFCRFRETWPAEKWSDTPGAFKAWFAVREARQESIDAAVKKAGGGNGELPDPVLGGLCRHKGSDLWRRGYVTTPERWLQAHAWNDPAPVGASSAPAAPEGVQYRRWEAPE